MFSTIPEMLDHMNNLKEAHDKMVEQKKLELNYKCEACQKNPIEVDYKYNNYSWETYTENGSKLRLNAHYFCKNCYKTIINTKQLEKSQWMAEIDKELFGE
jgi:hypothetical protein